MMVKCGLHITENQLQESADDLLDTAFRLECERHIPNTDEIEPAEAANAFLFLKANFYENRV